MKKKHWIVTGVLSFLLTASLILNGIFLYQDISKASNQKKTTLLKANLSIDWIPGTPMGGWFIEHLKEKLGIHVWQEDYPVVEGDSIDCLNWLDLCYMNCAESYYDAVREGKLMNLEDEVKKRSWFYQRYRNAFDQIKADTLKHAGKEGIYGIPADLTYFNSKGEEGLCLTIPVSSSHPKEAMELVAYSASNEGIMNIAYGPEGQMWEKKKGKYVLLQDWREMSSGNGARKFIKTKNGMEDFETAVCKLHLVGSNLLGQRLLLMSSDSKREESKK